MTRIVIPKTFLIDHMERDLPTPAILAEDYRHFAIDSADPAIDELRNDAEYYASPDGPDMAGGLKRAAKALLSALAAATAEPSP